MSPGACDKFFLATINVVLKNAFIIGSFIAPNAMHGHEVLLNETDAITNVCTLAYR